MEDIIPISSNPIVTGNSKDLSVPSVSLPLQNNEQYKDDKKQLLRKYVYHKKWNEAWGHTFVKRLQKVINEKIKQVENENISLKNRIEAAEQVEKFLKNLGLDSPDWYTGNYGEEKLKRDLEKIQKPFGGNLNYVLKTAIENLTTIQNIISGKGE